MAQATGAAPRYAGSSEPWTLMPPWGGDGQHLSREALAVGGHDEQVGGQGAQGGHHFGALDALRLQHGDGLFLGDGLHAAARLARGAAFLSGGAVGLGDQADDGVRAGEQGLEGGLGKGAGPHHDDAHGASGEGRAARARRRRAAGLMPAGWDARRPPGHAPASAASSARPALPCSHHRGRRGKAQCLLWPNRPARARRWRRQPLDSAAVGQGYSLL